MLRALSSLNILRALSRLCSMNIVHVQLFQLLKRAVVVGSRTDCSLRFFGAQTIERQQLIDAIVDEGLPAPGSTETATGELLAPLLRARLTGPAMCFHTMLPAAVLLGKSLGASPAHSQGLRLLVALRIRRDNATVTAELAQHARRVGEVLLDLLAVADATPGDNLDHLATASFRAFRRRTGSIAERGKSTAAGLRSIGGGISVLLDVELAGRNGGVGFHRGKG